MGVFGGIVVGLGVRRPCTTAYYKIQLPQVLSFFSGTRFVPIVSAAGAYLLVGIAMYYIWPVIQTGINALGGFVLASGYAGTWLYGFIERALIPFWSAPCVLYSVLADRARRHGHGGRRDSSRARRTSSSPSWHSSGHHAFLGRGDPLYEPVSSR